MQSAVEMLVGRIKALHELLQKMQTGEAPLDAGLLRQAAGLAQRLPAMDAPGFSDDYGAERADAMLSILLAAVTKGTAQVNSLVEKYSVAYERGMGGKRGGKGGPSGLPSSLGGARGYGAGMMAMGPPMLL